MTRRAEEHAIITLLRTIKEIMFLKISIRITSLNNVHKVSAHCVLRIGKMNTIESRASWSEKERTTCLQGTV